MEPKSHGTSRCARRTPWNPNSLCARATPQNPISGRLALREGDVVAWNPISRHLTLTRTRSNETNLKAPCAARGKRRKNPISRHLALCEGTPWNPISRHLALREGTPRNPISRHLALREGMPWNPYRHIAQGAPSRSSPVSTVRTE